MKLPLPFMYYPDFIAVDQEARADNVMPSTDNQAHLAHLHANMRAFRAWHFLDRVVVF